MPQKLWIFANVSLVLYVCFADRCFFVVFFFAIVWSVLPYTDSDYLLLSSNSSWKKPKGQLRMHNPEPMATLGTHEASASYLSIHYILRGGTLNWQIQALKDCKKSVTGKHQKELGLLEC